MGRRIETSRDWHVGARPASLAGAVLWGIAVARDRRPAGGRHRRSPSPDQRAQGRELFEREWLPGDSRTHGGDGLGPVYNDSSCIACHNLGGNGGAGPASKNVDIITASPNGQTRPADRPRSSAGEPSFLGKIAGVADRPRHPDEPKTKRPRRRTSHGLQARRHGRKLDTGPLVKAHPGFRTSRSVVLHHFGTESGYETWRHVDDGARQLHARGDSMPEDQGDDAGPECGQHGPATVHAEQHRPVRAGPLPAEPDGPVRYRADRLHPRSRDRGRREGQAPGLPRGRRAGQPAEGQADRPVRLEGADGVAGRLRPDGLRRGAGPGGPRPSPGRQSPETRGPGQGPRPHRRRNATP